jgi:hypothetical protein
MAAFLLDDIICDIPIAILDGRGLNTLSRAKLLKICESG